MPPSASVPPARALPDCPPDRRVREGCCRTVRPVVGGEADAPLPYALSQVRVGVHHHNGRAMAGRGRALGYATVHWGRLLTCPNGWFPTPMPSSAPVPPAHALPQWLVSYPNAARGARGHYADEAGRVFAAMPPLSQGYRHFENSASLAKRTAHRSGRLRFSMQNSGQRILDNLTRVGPCWYPIQNSTRGHSRPNAVPVGLLSDRKLALRRLSMAEAGIGSESAG